MLPHDDCLLVNSSSRKRLTPNDLFVDESTIFENPRPAPSPPSTKAGKLAPSAKKSVRLSSFDFDMAVLGASTSRTSKRISKHHDDVFSCPLELEAPAEILVYVDRKMVAILSLTSVQSDVLSLK